MLEKMRIYTRVIELKGFRKAAKDLGISTPVVTKRINELEAELATKLIQRSTRTLAITEAGKLFYDKSKEILNTLANTKATLTSLKTEVAGTIKIGLAHAINHQYFTPMIPKLLRKHPNIQLEIIQGNHLLGLLDHHFDVVMHCGTLPDSSFHYKKLGNWRKITCASPRYFKKFGKPQTPNELANHNCLDHADNLQHNWNYRANNKPYEQLISGNVTINNSTDLKQLALAGTGIVYLPSFIVHEEITNKLLVPVLETYEPEPLGIFLVYPSKQFISKKTQVIIDCIEQLLKPSLITY